MSKDEPSSDEEAQGPLLAHNHPKFNRPRPLESAKWFAKLLTIVGILFILQRAYSFYTRQQPDYAVDSPPVANNEPTTSTTAPPHSANDEYIKTVHYPGADPVFGSKSIIVASTSKENTSWFHEHHSDWQLIIYVVDNPNATYTVPQQGGNEAGVFLTYIIDHYDTLPDFMLFNHADRFQWHNEDPMFDGVPVIKNLQLQHVREEGYVNLRCNWYPGCPMNVEPILGHKDAWDEQRGETADRYANWFPDRPVPSTLGSPCCAQFALTKEQVRLRTVEEYKRMRGWLWDTNLIAHNSGRVMEYLWHVVFSKSDVDCPLASVCFCKKFGLCELECPQPGYCEGRWYQPPYWIKIPKTWPQENHGVPGMKPYGWWQEWYPNETFGLEWTDAAFQARQAERARVAKAKADEEAKPTQEFAEGEVKEKTEEVREQDAAAAMHNASETEAKALEKDEEAEALVAAAHEAAIHEVTP